MPAALAVRSAGFTPVKGMRHVAHERVELDERGPVGDRIWCLVDAGRGAVLRTVQHPELVSVVARQDGAELALTLPTGEQVVGESLPTGESLASEYWGRPVDLELVHGPHSALLSDFLGREVRLASAPRGGVVFASPVTVVGTASLHDLAELSGHAPLAEEAARFRATLVVETDRPYVEETWLGDDVLVGDARLRVGGPIPRCAVVDADPETGARGPRVLRTLAAHRPRNAAGEPVFGVYADVVSPGVVATQP